MYTSNIAQIKNENFKNVRAALFKSLTEKLANTDNYKNKHIKVAMTTSGLSLTLFNKGLRPTVYSVELDSSAPFFCSAMLDTLSMRQEHRGLKKKYSISIKTLTRFNNNALTESLIELALQPCDGSEEDTNANFTPIGLLYDKKSTT